MTRRVMVLDDNPDRHDSFDEAFGDSSVEHAWTYWDAVNLLKTQRYDVVYLDHDLNDFDSVSSVAGMYGGDSELTGQDVARFIARELGAALRPGRVVVHSWNVTGGRAMVAMLRDAGVVCTYEPFQPPKNAEQEDP